MTAKVKQDDDLDTILPVGGTFEVDGIPAVVNRLKAREFLSLMRVLTQGLGAGAQEIIGSMKFDSDDKDQMAGQIIGLFVLAIPNAIEQFGDFLLSVVTPKDPADRGKLMVAMQNPEIEVLLDVFTLIAEQEKDDLASLVGKAKAAVARISSVYQTTGR